MPKLSKRKVKTCWLAFFTAALALTFGAQKQEPELAFVVPSLDASLNQPITAPQLRYQYVSNGSTALVHASSATALPDGRIFAVWFAGSREGAEDVTIHGAYLPLATDDKPLPRWSDPEVIVTPKTTQSDLQRFVRKVGNPVVLTHPNGSLYMFYVSVSMGGWATSALNMIISNDLGSSWSEAKRLITSPFLNLSTLVKGTPYIYQNGDIALPIYHELAGKFGELLIVSESGEVIGKSRLSSGRSSLQPVLFLLDEHKVGSLLRYAAADREQRALWVDSNDAGRSWSEPSLTDIPNPNSALAGLALGNGDLLAVSNDRENYRDRLSLLLSKDKGVSWQVLYRFEDETGFAPHEHRHVKIPVFKAALKASAQTQYIPLTEHQIESAVKQMCGATQCKFRFDYPYVIKSGNNYHLLYTWNKTYIKHIEFNQAWLEELM